METTQIDTVKWLIDALDHLKQYQAYSEHMRADGKGFTPSSPFSPEYLNSAIKSVIQNNSDIIIEHLSLRQQSILEG